MKVDFGISRFMDYFGRGLCSRDTFLYWSFMVLRQVIFRESRIQEFQSFKHSFFQEDSERLVLFYGNNEACQQFFIRR